MSSPAIDWSAVRVHVDGAAQRLTARHAATAVAVGRDIAFAPGTFAPGTAAGEERLRHELGHVAQQTVAGVSAIQRQARARQGHRADPAEATSSSARRCRGRAAPEDDHVRFSHDSATVPEGFLDRSGCSSPAQRPGHRRAARLLVRRRRPDLQRQPVGASRRGGKAGRRGDTAGGIRRPGARPRRDRRLRRTRRAEPARRHRPHRPLHDLRGYGAPGRGRCFGVPELTIDSRLPRAGSANGDEPSGRGSTGGEPAATGSRPGFRIDGRHRGRDSGRGRSPAAARTRRCSGRGRRRCSARTGRAPRCSAAWTGRGCTPRRTATASGWAATRAI